MAVQGLDENATFPSEPQLADSLTEALKSLKEGSGLLQEPIPPEGLSGMFSGLNLDDVSANLFSIERKHLKMFHFSFRVYHRNLVTIHSCQLCKV